MNNNNINNELLIWNIYEVTSPQDLQGIMLRGRVRKFSLDLNFNLLVENAERNRNCVRIAVLIKDIDDERFQKIKDYIQTLEKDVNIKLLIENISNPILSKPNANDESRYTV